MKSIIIYVLLHSVRIPTLLLGLYGGLVIIVDVVTVWQKILIRQRQRRAQVQPM